MGMKDPTIKKVLNKKLSAWIETIKSEKVRELAKRDAIVSGGAITSMVMGEKINDYDIYFATREAALAIAHYYTQLFISNNPKLEYHPRVQGSDTRVKIFMKSAGVASETQSGYQYFETMDPEFAKEFADSLKLTQEKSSKYRPVFLSENAVTLSDKTQLIIRFWGEPEDIHRNFDYVHAMCSYRYNSKNLIIPAESMRAMLSRSLVYKGSLYPLASLFRLRKFIERGWRITAGQILKISFQISQMDLTDQSVLYEQLIGVDQAYMAELLEAINEHGREIDATYLALLVDTIFEDAIEPEEEAAPDPS